jgi:hypothetical protein
MAAKTETHYRHLEPRPGSNYRQLFLKRRRIHAGWSTRPFTVPTRRACEAALSRQSREREPEPF